MGREWIWGVDAVNGAGKRCRVGSFVGWDKLWYEGRVNPMEEESFH